jgi:hypothetical protein
MYGRTSYKMIGIYIIIGVVAWYVLGCIVLASIDTNQELYEWVWDKAPNGWYSMLAIFLFPLVAINYIYRKRHARIIERRFHDE